MRSISLVVRVELKTLTKACVICLIALSAFGQYKSMDDTSKHEIFKMMISKGGGSVAKVRDLFSHK